MFIEASRRASRAAVERVRSALIEYDRVVFKQVQRDVPAESAFSVVRDGGTYVLAFTDPTVEPVSSWGTEAEEWERDCGY